MMLTEKYEIEPSRAALLFTHFENFYKRIISGELDYGEGEIDCLAIGDQYDMSMRSSIGYMENSKYGIHLSWCSLQTLIHGEVVRYVADIDRAKDGGEVVHRIVVESCEHELQGIFYSHPGPLSDELHPNEIVLNLIMKELAEYPSVYCCKD